ncbi:hypothetical protein MANES_15G176249v8 [Manihot esculenta]|uniref:Uncharacterized protein n=1 Tax=Manihot esculenta TaxID=3983 RepID=A0ACB7GCA2_MANES|nr:hypothetical protein MANES_15G176249v8 [Manihot esculenta]
MDLPFEDLRLSSRVRSITSIMPRHYRKKFTILSTHVFNFQALAWYLKSALQNKDSISQACMIQIIRKARKDLRRKDRKQH